MVLGLSLLSLIPLSLLSLIEKYEENIEQEKVLSHPMGEAEFLKREKIRSRLTRDPLPFAPEAAASPLQDLCLPLFKKTPLLGTTTCFYDEAALTSASSTPWCCPENMVFPELTIHPPSRQPSPRTNASSRAYACGRAEGWEVEVSSLMNICLYTSFTFKYKQTETPLSSSHTSMIAQRVSFSFLLRVAYTCHFSFLTSIPALGFCTKCSTTNYHPADYQRSPHCQT